jgi:hypothetical protein
VPVGGDRLFLRTTASKRSPAEVKDSASSDQNGQFSFRDLAPGDYVILLKKKLGGNPSAEAPHVNLSLVEAERKIITVKTGQSEPAHLTRAARHSDPRGSL